MLSPNQVLQNRYEIVRSIGQGGMGAVYLATDRRLGHAVALKQTLFDDDFRRRAFEREAKLLASLRHQALPRVSDYFSEESGLFLVMEYIPGEDLSAMLAARGGIGFEPRDVLAWADQLLDALDYLHTHQPPVVHRDIKPQNLKLTPRSQIILLDFGLAKGSPQHLSHSTTQERPAFTSASIFGYTPNFAPLEQIQGEGTDPRSDLYALAATLHYLLTAKRPPDALARATAVLNGEPDPLRPAHELNAQISPGVSEVLMQAMAQSRERRPASAASMRQALREASDSALTNSGAIRPTVSNKERDETESPTLGLTNAATLAATLAANKPQDFKTNVASKVDSPFVTHAMDAPLKSSINKSSDEFKSARPAAVVPAPSSGGSKRKLVAGGAIAAALVAGISFAAIGVRRASQSSPNVGMSAPAINAPASNVNAPAASNDSANVAAQPSPNASSTPSANESKREEKTNERANAARKTERKGEEAKAHESSASEQNAHDTGERNNQPNIPPRTQGYAPTVPVAPPAPQTPNDFGANPNGQDLQNMPLWMRRMMRQARKRQMQAERERLREAGDAANQQQPRPRQRRFQQQPEQPPR